MMSLASDDILTGHVPRRVTQVRPLVPTAFQLAEGELLQIIDLQGKQVADFVAFSKHDLGEYLSPSHTRSTNNSLMLIKEMPLYSNRRNQMLFLLEDTVGRHDLLYPACDRRGYLVDYGVEDHPGCRDNFFTVLAPYGVDYDHIPDPVHWFMHVGLKTRAEFEVREPLSEPNDYVLLRAMMDLIVAVSACPQDQNACNVFNPTDILVRVYH
jgi:uncharacterized protein YcgI (DUF1989 family)